MRVRMKQGIGGYRDGELWPAVGECIDVPEHEARDLISQHYAEEAHDDDAAATSDHEQAATSDEEAEAGPDDGPEATADEDAADEAVTTESAASTIPTRPRKASGKSS